MTGPAPPTASALPAASALHAALARAAAGLPIDPEGLPPRAVRALAVADRLGAPRAPALRAAAAAAREADDLAGAVAVAAAEGRSVARALVVAPPVVGPAAALLVTDTPLAVWHTPVGRALLVLALLLWATGALVVRMLVARATATGSRLGSRGHTEELLELAAIALGAGCGLPASLRRAADVLGGDAPAGVAPVALWLEVGAEGPVPTGWEQVGPPLAAARRDGVPLVVLVRSLAGAARRQHHQQALERAARLGARLTMPTTLLLLPAALLVVGAPLLHGALAAVT